MVTALTGLWIVVNGVDVTSRVPPEDFIITLENAQHIDTADFIIKDAGSLTVERWDIVIIQDLVADTTYFWGYITDFRKVKDGLKVDFHLNCSSFKVRLDKTFIDGSCTGTDAEIIDLILGGAFPDLSPWIDTTNVTALLDSDLTMDFSNSNALEALNDLADRVGAEWNLFPPDGDVRVNFFKNPHLRSDASYINDDPTGATGSWAGGTGSWGAGYGETGGGYQIASQNIAATDMTHIGIGNDVKATGFTIPVSLMNSGSWMVVSLRAKIDAGANVAKGLTAYTYDLEENLFGTISIGLPIPSFGTSWVTVDGALDLSDATKIPAAGYVEFRFRTLRASGAYTLSVDKILIETVYSVEEPTAGAYFDGDSANSGWYGNEHDSQSWAMGDGQDMNWDIDAPAAAYDVDTGSMDEIIQDLQLNMSGMDDVNSIIVIGGTEMVAFSEEYPANGRQDHFDLEEKIFPQAGETAIQVSHNDGNDGAPTWDDEVVGNMDTDDFSGSATVLYDPEDHWLKFETAPPALERAFRVIGRRKKRVQATVNDEVDQANLGITLVDTLYDESITSEDDAHALGYAELGRRTGTKVLNFTTYEPGLFPGTKMAVTDIPTGLSAEDFIIQRVVMSFLGGGYTRSEVEAGPYVPDTEDLLHAGDRQYIKNALATAEADYDSVTLGTLTDDDGEPLTDDDGSVLFQSTAT